MELVGPDGQPVQTPEQDYQTRVLSTVSVMYRASEAHLPDLSLDEFLTACLFMFANGVCEHGQSVSFATSRARLGIKRMWPGISAAVKQAQESGANR